MAVTAAVKEGRRPSSQPLSHGVLPADVRHNKEMFGPMGIASAVQQGSAMSKQPASAMADCASLTYLAETFAFPIGWAHRISVLGTVVAHAEAISV